MSVVWLFSAVALLIGSLARSDEIYQNYYSTRALGMGNAFTAVVDDHTALVYNPAGLDKIKNLHLTLLAFNIGTDVTSPSTVTDLTGNNYATVVQNYFGKELWLVTNAMAAMTIQDVGLGGYAQALASFDLHNPAYPNVAINLAVDYAEVGGFAIGLLPEDVLRIGFMGKRITRYGGQITLAPSTLVTLSNTQITNLINNSGTGYGLDTGVILELPTATHPAFSFVWHDVGQTAFGLSTGNSQLQPIDNDFVAGFSMRIEGAGFTLRPAFDFTNINASSEQIGKRFHAGAEMTFSVLTVRGGVNEGYYTAGAGVRFKALQIDAATYGEEIGVYPGQLEDRRYLVSLTLDLEVPTNWSVFGKENGPLRPGFQRR